MTLVTKVRNDAAEDPDNATTQPPKEKGENAERFIKPCESFVVAEPDGKRLSKNGGKFMMDTEVNAISGPYDTSAHIVRTIKSSIHRLVREKSKAAFFRRRRSRKDNAQSNGRTLVQGHRYIWFGAP